MVWLLKRMIPPEQENLSLEPRQILCVAQSETQWAAVSTKTLETSVPPQLKL